MEVPLKILLLEDSRTDAELIQRLLIKEKMNCEFQLTKNKAGFLHALEEFSPDVILSDNSMPKFDATEALQITRQRFIHIPFILVTGTVSEEFAANIIRQGADDYILKDRLTRLPAAIDAALRKQESEKEKLRAVQNLIRSEEKYRQLVERVSDGFIALDTKWNFVYANKIAEEMLGRPAGYLTGKNIWAEFPESIHGHLYEAYYRAMRKQKNIHLREYSVSVNRWMETSIFPSQSGLSVYFRDITEQKKAEEEILKSEEQYKDLVENITDLICTHDLDGRILSMNKAAEELIGHKFNPEENLNIRDILTRDKKNLFDPYITELKKKERVQGLMKVKTFTGKIQFWEYHNSLKITEGNTPIVRGYARDITDRKEAEEKRKKLEAELLEQQRKAQLQMISTALKAQEKERNAIGQELHDNVNQILVGTKMILSMAKNYPDKIDELINSSIKNLQEAISENRKIAHELVTPDFEATKLVDQISSLAESMLKNAGLDTFIDTSRLQDELLDEDQKLAIYRIAQEQCTNIVKYAKAKLVNISLATNDNFFKMIIADDGLGMETGKITLGIGLRNIKGRLSIFNGTVDINTAPDKGFVLEIIIPL